jgi:hypothetical protein
MKKVLSLLLCMSLLFAVSVAQAASMDKTTGIGQYRIIYKSPAPASCEVFIMGVGTAMSRSDYDNLGNAMANTYGYVLVVMDHNPGNMVKTDPAKYRNCALEVKNNILIWMSGTGCTSVAHWILGGHSAGGEAAQNAVSADPSLADGIFSIDPYNIEGAGRVGGPAMYWGFNVTTCFVEKTDAAEAAYYYTDGPRAFYRVKRVYGWTICGYAPKFFHCSFCDLHCPGCTNCVYTPSYFYADIAKSVNKFITAAFYGTWSKANLTISATTPLELFVDSDAP